MRKPKIKRPTRIKQDNLNNATRSIKGTAQNGDDEFMRLSREARVCRIIATCSWSEYKRAPLSR